MPVSVQVPVRVRLDLASVEGRECCLSDALGAALGRALARSRAHVLRPRAGFAGVEIHAPTFTWTGDMADRVDGGTRARLETRIRAAIAEQAAAAGLFEEVRKTASAAAPLMDPAAEPFDSSRGDDLFGFYRVPSYNGKGRGATVKMAARTKAPAEWEYEVREFWKFQDPGWWKEISLAEYEEIERSAFEENGVPLPAGPRALVSRLPDPQWRFGLTVNRLPGNTSIALKFTGFPQSRPFQPAPGKYEFRQVSVVPPARPGFVQWVSAEDVRATIRSDIEVQIEECAKGLEAAIPAEARAELIEREIKRRLPLPKGHTRVLVVIVGGVVSYLAMQGQAPYWSGPAPAVPLSESQRVAVTKKKKKEEEGGGEGERAEAGGREAEGKGKAEGKVEGAEPGETAFFEAGVKESAPAVRGAHFPSLSGAAGELICDEPFDGEPSLDELGEDGEVIRRRMEEIAYKLDLQPCPYAGRFALNAAAVVGLRALAVSEYGVADDHEGFVKQVRSPRKNLGSMEFAVLPSPSVQLLRHLAGVVDLLSSFSSLVRQVYAKREHALKIKGFRRGFATGWMLDFGYPFVNRVKYSVGQIFVAACRVVFMQLLRTSRHAILSRKNNPPYAKLFEELIRGELVKVDELDRLRDQLKTWVPAENLKQAGSQIAEGVHDRWKESRGLLLDLFELRNPFANVAWSPAGTIVRGDRGQVGIRDSAGSVWTLDQLNRAIAIRRETVEEVDPLLQQITGDERVLVRFTRNPNNIQTELANLLEEMDRNNQDIIDNVKGGIKWAFEQGPISRNCQAQTVPGTGYEFRGVHLLAHEAIGDAFRGNTFYVIGLLSLMLGQEGWEDFKVVAELGGFLALAVLCAPLALAYGAAWATYHEYEAYMKGKIYGALIQPELLISRVELEAERFAADLGALLTFVPLGRMLAKPLGTAARQAAAGEIRAAARALVRRAGRRITLELLKALEKELVTAFVTEFVKFEVISYFFSKLLVEPVIAQVQLEYASIDDLLELAALVE